ncbi:MAG: vitamin B12-dependent ribonucleotide reductase [Candidatus Sumerlaeia bacterium]
MRLSRFFTKEVQDPYAGIKWEFRDTRIVNEKGQTVFEQTGVECPSTWSQMALNVVASKYFRGKPGTPERESSVKGLVERVARTLHEWGRQDGYFATREDGDIFYDELRYLLVHQYASFNSPVWFNVGVEKRPQCSACFINSVEDTMESILGLAKTEGMLFKYGSGTGTNLSPIRSSREGLGGGGIASGPVSFMKGYDAFAGVIKSGGKTRRAAKMVILNVDHPDILEFIRCKAREEKKAWALIDAGFDGSLDGEAYATISYQNANHSVRVTDAFMRAVESDGPWHTKFVRTGEKCEEYRARDLWAEIAEAAWVCGDPGLQFHDTINAWHTCPNTAPINASNPCSEYMFLDDSACNLASLNLMKFFSRDDGSFDVDAYRFAVNIIFLAQEIIVSNASYPTQKIGVNSENYRPLGLGFANLGALLMTLGLPYDSDEGRATAAALAAVMTGEAYSLSAVMAAARGPFQGFAVNREPMLNVMRMHRDAAHRIAPDKAGSTLAAAARRVWDRAVALGERHGYRNAQATVIAPTGTIAFMMDCDTTGIEPDIALVKYKRLVGGGMLKIVNQTVAPALKRLGYAPAQIQTILAWIDENDTIEGAPGLRPEHLPIFDCAFRPLNGTRFIHHMGHLRMMAAVQPFISGAISKTVNMPSDSTPEQIADTYMQAWKLGLKAVALYRDGCKRVQPLSQGEDKSKKSAASGSDAPAQARTAAQKGTPASPASPEPRPLRRRLPVERAAITHKFDIAGHEGYVTVGLYEDGMPGEIFIRMNKEGSTISGLMDGFAVTVSLCLQYGVPLEVLIDKFSFYRFEPSGMTKNPQIPFAKSILDYIFRWLASKFLSPEGCEQVGVLPRTAPAPESERECAGGNSCGEDGGGRATGGGTDDVSARGAAAGQAAAEDGNSRAGAGKGRGADQQLAEAASSAATPAVGRSAAHRSSVLPHRRRPSGHHGTALKITFAQQADAPACSDCGSIMVRNGACYKCLECGTTYGCG